MTNFSIKKLIILGTVLLVTGFTAFAFAHGGGYHMGGGHMWNNLSVDDQQKMQDQMNIFFSSTQELRNQYDQKRTELNQEYANPEKDQTKVDAIEKELFDLSTKIEKERFEHMKVMRNLFADKSPGYHMGRGGYGGCF